MILKLKKTWKTAEIVEYPDDGLQLDTSVICDTILAISNTLFLYLKNGSWSIELWMHRGIWKIENAKP